MMKKLTKAALLAAATVFMLAACSHSSGGGSGEEENPPNTPEVPEENSTSYDFADLTEADLTTLGVTLTGGNDVKIATANTADKPYMVLNGKVGIVTTVKEKLTVKPKDGAPLAIGFNTNGLNREANDTTEVGQTVTLAHFITYPVVSGKKYQMTITSGGQANKEGHYFVVTDTSGKILASKACSTSTTDAVTLDAFEVKEEVIRLSVHRSNSSGTSYIGKVTLTEITTEVKVTDIAISADSERKVTVNKTLQLTATVAPENATSKRVEWKSSDDTKATVSENGLVTGVAAGEVKITATATDGSGVEGEITLTVVEDSESSSPTPNPDDEGENPDDDEEEEETPVIGEKLSVDFTTFEAAVVCEAASTTPVRLGDTDFFAVSGTDGKVIELKKQNNAMALNFGGTGAVDKNAVFFYAKKGSATVTVKYYQGSADRYVKVLNEDMDTTEATDDEKTTTDKAVKTRVIAITIDEDSTPVYIGSANSGIYVASIDVVYN